MASRQSVAILKHKVLFVTMVVVSPETPEAIARSLFFLVALAALVVSSLVPLLTPAGVLGHVPRLLAAFAGAHIPVLFPLGLSLVSLFLASSAFLVRHGWTP